MRTASKALALLVCLILAVTAQGMAFARGQTPAEGRMVLCTGQGAVMVFTDAEGRPTAPPQLCMDGVQALLAAVAWATAEESRNLRIRDMRWSFTPVSFTHADRPRLSARDPPRL